MAHEIGHNLGRLTHDDEVIILSKNHDMWLFQNFQEYPYDEDLIMNSVISDDAYIWSPNAMMDIRIHVRCYKVVIL